MCVPLDVKHSDRQGSEREAFYEAIEFRGTDEGVRTIRRRDTGPISLKYSRQIDEDVVEVVRRNEEGEQIQPSDRCCPRRWARYDRFRSFCCLANEWGPFFLGRVNKFEVYMLHVCIPRVGKTKTIHKETDKLFLFIYLFYFISLEENPRIIYC